MMNSPAMISARYPLRTSWPGHFSFVTGRRRQPPAGGPELRVRQQSDATFRRFDRIARCVLFYRAARVMRQGERALSARLFYDFSTVGGPTVFLPRRIQIRKTRPRWTHVCRPSGSRDHAWSTNSRGWPSKKVSGCPLVFETSASRPKCQ